MAANTSPIFIKTPKASWSGVVLTANTARDGTGTVSTIFTADATNGSRMDEVNVLPVGTNSQTTVVRFFLNNGSANSVAANNVLLHEETLANSTASQTGAIALSQIIIWKPGLVLPPGYKVNMTIGTTLDVGCVCSAIGGDF